MMGRVSDMAIFVARADYSPKANFRFINELVADNKLPKVSLVLNGLDLSKKRYGYYYGYKNYGGRYGYGYGYGYGYTRYGHYGMYGNYSSTNEGEVVTEK